MSIEPDISLFETKKKKNGKKEKEFPSIYGLVFSR